VRRALALLGGILLAAGVTACAGGGAGTRAAAPVANAHATGSPSSAPLRFTPENTYERGADDLAWSHVVGGVDRRQMTAVLKRYYAAAAAEDGVEACALMYSLFAEEVPEDESPAALRGQSCATVAASLFKQRHRELVADNATFRVTLVRVSGRRGLALLKFGNRPERDIRMHREGHRWKVEELLDSGMS
jgi:hypothetical protein